MAAAYNDKTYPHDKNDNDHSYVHDAAAAIQRISDAVSAPLVNARNIYDDIKHNVLPILPPIATPPLPLLVYAVRSILQPSFILDLIPDLLSLIAHLEVFRLNTIDKIRRLIRRDKLCHRDQDRRSVRLLADNHRTDLERLVSPSRIHAARKVYRQIVHGCSLLYIHHVWRSPNGQEGAISYLIQYFPYFAQRDPDAVPQCNAACSNHPWHYNLSLDEQHENETIGQIAANFIIDASLYLENKEAYCHENGFSVEAPFDELFPPPRQDANGSAIEKYMSTVSSSAETLEAIMNDDQ